MLLLISMLQACHFGFFFFHCFQIADILQNKHQQDGLVYLKSYEDTSAEKQTETETETDPAQLDKEDEKQEEKLIDI